MSFIKKLFIFIIIIIFLIAFSNSYASLSISNLVLFVALGIDKLDDGRLDVTFQFTSSSPVSSTGSTEKNEPLNFTITADSINTAINLMNTYTGKEINLSHCKVIVFSEKIASIGISDEIYTLMNNSQIRPSTNIIISKSSAKEYIKSSKAEFENLQTKYYEVFTNSSKYTGFSSDATIGSFFNALVSRSEEPYAILGNINPTNISGYSGTENTGLAVFNDATLVGELSPTETLSFLAIKNLVDGFMISVPDPTDKNSFIDVYITPMKNSRINPSIINGAPLVDCSFSYSGKIHSLKSDDKYLSDDILNSVSNSCSIYLKDIFTDFLYTCSKDFEVDIADIGKYSRTDFLSSSEFNNYDWSNKFKNSFFNVDVWVKIRSGFLLTET